MKLKLILTAAIVGMVASLLGAAAAARADPFAYVPNSGDGSVSQYDIGAVGLLAPLSPATVATGADPRAVAVSPDGQSVYVANFNSGSVSQYDVGAGGALSPKSPATVATGDGPDGVAVSPDGGSVYVANFDSGSVSQYDVGAGGALSPKSPATVATCKPVRRRGLYLPVRGGGEPGRGERLRLQPRSRQHLPVRRRRRRGALAEEPGHRRHRLPRPGWR